MIANKKKAAVSAGTEPTAQNHILQNELYQDRHQQSSFNLKEKNGSLLLYLQSQPSQYVKEKCWTLFDLTLRRNLYLKLYEVQV